MKTVKWLREELAKFPDDALCFAYEGEITGIIIEKADRLAGEQGWIYLGEDEVADEATVLLPTDQTKEVHE